MVCDTLFIINLRVWEGSEKQTGVIVFFDTWIWVYSYHYNIQGVEKFGHSLMTTVQFQVENYFLKRFLWLQ